MPVIQTSVFTVVKRFPDRKDTVKQLFKESETFQSVCEDYRRCAEALRHWNESASEEAPCTQERICGATAGPGSGNIAEFR